MVRKLFLGAALAALLSPAAAQDTKGTPEGLKSGVAPTAFVADDFPFEGEITVERLNVRLFPRPDAATSIVAAVLASGEKVTVLGQKDDFFQILPPRGTSVWIWARSVRKEGEEGLVIGNEVPVRLDSRVNAEKVASLDEGAKVRILRENLGWFQIAPPQTVKYFVARKYVKYSGKAAAQEIAAAPAPAADEARDKMVEAERLASEQNTLVAEKRLKELDFAKVADAFDAVVAAPGSEEVKKVAATQARAYRQLAAHWALHSRSLEDAEAKLKALQAEIARRNAPEEKTWDFTGHLDTVGMIWNRPGAHKLIMGGKVVCYIKPKEGQDEMIGRFNSLFQKYVGVKGTVVKLTDSFEGQVVVVVDSIEELKK